MRKARKAISFLLTLSMIASLFTGMTAMAVTEEGTKISKVDTLTDGESYLITATFGDTTYALSTETISSSYSGWRAAEEITISDGRVASPSDLANITWNYSMESGFENAGDASKVLRMATSYIFTNGTATTDCAYDGTSFTGDGKTVQLATQTVGGLTTYCFDTAGGTNSGTTKTQAIDIYKVVDEEEEHIHSYTESITTPATCGEAGVKTFLCACGDSYTETIDATGEHSYVDGICSVCGAEEPVHVHTWVTDAAVEATCTETGLTEGSHCSECGEVQTEQTVVEALGHDYVDGTCIRCGAAKPAGGVYVERADTLEDGGLYIIADTDGVYAMSVNNSSAATSYRAAVAIQVENGAVTASGADLSELLWTCTSDTDGMKLGNSGLYLTAYYSYLYAQETPGSYCNTWALSDGVLRSTKSSYSTYCVKYNAGYGFNNAAASSTAITLYKVSLCSHENKTNEQTIPATCTTDGSYSFYCSDCETTVVNVLPALGHAGVLQSETAAYWEYKCGTCGETYQVLKDERLQAMTLTGVNAAFSSDGDYEWEYDAENNRLQSTNKGISGTNSITTITFNAEKAFNLSFDYSVNSESYYDYLTLTLDGTQLACTKVSSQNGQTLSFSYPETELTAGEHTLKLDYKKDSSGDYGEDRAYLSNLAAAAVCDHDWVKGDTTAPTCTERGYTTYTCSVCGNSKQDDFTDALGHVRGDVYTDNWDGTHTYSCTRTDDCAGGTEAHTYIDGVCACGALEPVTVGSETSTLTTPYPYYMGMKNSTSQTIYTAAEIGKAGTIKSIAYDVAKAVETATTSVKIYMGHTDKEKFGGTAEYLTTATGLTLVYEGTPTLGKAVGWEELKLDTPFFYNGVDNLVIAVTHTADATSTGLYYRYTSAADRILYRGSSTAAYADIDSTSAYYKSDYVPNVQLRMEEHTHIWVEGETVAPTCLTEGYTPITCTCGALTKKDVLPALGHDFGEDGLCIRCGVKEIKTYADLFYAIEPYFDLSETTSAADKWTADMYQGMPVTKSSGTNTITLTALDTGTLTVCAAQMNAGGTSYYVDKGYVTITVKDAEGNTVSTQKITNETSTPVFVTMPVHVEAGQTVEVYCYCYSSLYFQYMCAFAFTPDCVHEHAASDAGTVTAPTCTARGYTTYTCTKCAVEYRADYTAALGHDYAVVVVDPTCTEPGSKTETCQRAGCDSVIETVLAAAGHKFVDGYCTVCHEKAADSVQIGQSTTGSYNAPYGNYQYFSSQLLYTAEKIGSGGTITDIAFNVTNATSVTANVLKVYMGHKAETAFASKEDNLTLDDLTLVYSRTDTSFGAETGWEQLQLDTPFAYDGVNSLVVVFVVGKNETSWDTKYAYTSTSNAMLYTYSSTVTADTYQNVEAYGAAGAYLPDIQIGFKAEASAHPGTLTAVAASGNCVDGGNLAYWKCETCGKLFADAEGLTETTQEAVTLPAGGEHSYVDGVCSKCGAAQSMQVLQLVAHEISDGTLVIDLVAGQEITFSVMEYTLKCTYGDAVLAQITSALTGVEAIVNTAEAYIGLYAGNDDVTVAQGDVIASFTFTGVDAGGDYRFRLSTGDCYTGTETQLPWSSGYTGEDKTELPDPVEIGTPGADTTGTTVPTEDIVDNQTGAANAVVTGPADGWVVDGETVNTFTVSADVACTVAVAKEDGSYTILTAAANGDGTYSFSTTLTEGQTIVMVVKGDLNGNGEIEAVEVSAMLKAANGNGTLTAVQMLGADINADGTLDAAEISAILKAANGNGTLPW